MINIEDVKRLMAGRAGVFGLLASILEAEPDFEDIENLSKYLADLVESIEFSDENDDLLKGYEGLTGWLNIAKTIDRGWIDSKSAQEYAYLFHVEGLKKKYLFGGDGLDAVLSYIADMALKASGSDDMDYQYSAAKLQKEYVDRYLLPEMSSFCDALFKAAPDYGVYRYISLILHGMVNIDTAILGVIAQPN